MSSTLKRKQTYFWQAFGIALTLGMGAVMGQLGTLAANGLVSATLLIGTIGTSECDIEFNILYMYAYFKWIWIDLNPLGILTDSVRYFSTSDTLPISLKSHIRTQDEDNSVKKQCGRSLTFLLGKMPLTHMFAI